MKLLVYPPFAPPGIMPYSIAHLKGMIDEPVKAIDLNAAFHARRFNLNMDELAHALPVYEENNRRILNGGVPDHFEELLELIRREGPELVAFSLVYNSQCFYAQKLIEHLDVPIILGGPAVSPKLKGTHITAAQLKDYFWLKDGAPDFSDFYPEQYLSPQVIPTKSSEGCFHAQCAFCTHHTHNTYRELPLHLDGQYLFFIDDMIPLRRLKEISARITPGTRWWAQLRPSRDLVPELRNIRGLRSVAWGVESGSQRMLNRMRKGTKVEDIAAVLKEAKRLGIINTVYIMSGFPGETKEDFEKTIGFLRENDPYIDLVSTSFFGLQKGSYAYEHPEEFGISIDAKERTYLDEAISFTPAQEDYRKRYRKTIERINKIPKEYMYMKEQTLLL